MSGADVRYFMLGAYDLGLTNGEYVFLTIDLSPFSILGKNTWQGEDGRDEDAAMAFQGKKSSPIDHNPVVAAHRKVPFPRVFF